MERLGTLIAVTVLGSLGCLVATVPPALGAPTVKVASKIEGKLLVTGSGFVLYTFTGDRHNKDRCVKIRACSRAWPPYTTRGKPVAGRGVSSRLLGTIKLAHGKRQVTYAGHPLYRDSAAIGPGDDMAIGVSQFGGLWLAINPSGVPFNTAPA